MGGICTIQKWVVYDIAILTIIILHRKPWMPWKVVARVQSDEARRVQQSCDNLCACEVVELDQSLRNSGQVDYVTMLSIVRWMNQIIKPPGLASP